MRDKRGLRGKSRRDADDRAVERSKAEAAKERAAREAALELVETTINTHETNIDTLQDFRNRSGGFAEREHNHGPDAIMAVHWGRVGTGQSPVPKFATQADLAEIRRWVKANYRPLA